MKKQLIATGRLTYGTRRLVAGETFEARNQDARLLIALKRASEVADRPRGRLSAPPASLVTKVAGADPLDHDFNRRKGGSLRPPQTDDLPALRAEYERVLGKRPFTGWPAQVLRDKIAAARQAG